jgi:diguanylate cyclase (GGDEF)-like protein/PAS domain S-box-containing protein
LLLGNGERLPEGAWGERALASLGSALDAVVLVDESGCVAGWNATAADLLGWHDETNAGRHAWTALSPVGEATHLQVDLARILADPAVGPFRIERTIVAANGRVFTAEVAMTATQLEGRNVATLFLRDVSDRKRAESLREVEHRLARILAAARSGVEVAPEVCELLGTGLGFDHVELWLADDHDASLRLVTAWRRRGGGTFGELARRLVLGRGEDLAGMAWEIGETVCIDDAQRVEGLVRGDAIAADRLVGAAALPLRAGRRTVGVGVLARTAPDPLDSDLRQALHSVAVQLGHFAERRVAERRLAEETVALAAVSRATRQLTDAVDAATARMAICEAAVEVTGATFGFVALPDNEEGGLVVRACCPPIEGAETRRFPPDAPSAVMRAFTTGRAVFLGDIASDPDADTASAESAGVVSGLLQPILREGRSLGVLGIAWTTRQVTLDRSTRLLVRLLADEAAMALSRVELVGRLEAAARTDPLTGLANVRAWQEHLARELASAGRDGRPVAVALIDIDGFKVVNDMHGHQHGDRILRTSAASWQSQLRQGDLLARLGGDEFAVLLPGCRPDDAVAFAERLRAATQGATASVGIAYWDGSEALPSLMNRADGALYAAKAAGRDQVAVR